MKEVNTIFSKNFKKFREDNNLTQEDIAKQAGLSRSYIADLERGKRSPSLNTIDKLIRKTKIPFNYLFKDLIK
ncbi:helix-turn-helix domain-containing protein [Facklamia sp. P13069]|uniref:helix-turn-helix domain-containing protein n=1 Tax=Facklamia sp. P13069 TaxID=3421954 RepID=UPI003D184AAC